VRYAVLAHDLGKGATAPDTWPAHHRHESRGVRLADRVSARLRVPAECRDAARLAARWHGAIHRAGELRPATLLDLVMRSDALRRPERLEGLLEACECDALSRPGAGGSAYAPGAIIRAACAVVRGVRVAAIAQDAKLRREDGDGADIGTAIHAARLRALRAWKRAGGDRPRSS
jgi:tRNA nucleotidyltransferase (CCA-adding enzyme)